MQKTGRLELTWVGKYNEPVLEPRILLEDKSKSHGDPQSENMLIHGDNLIALQALQQDYAGRIKCIFIDPPYNTGAAFEHYDDNVEHSTWLSLMKSRLVLLHQLLADNGTIFIQIDDNEQAYLKVLCDEIFGRQNYINMVSVNAKVSAGASGGGEDKRLKKNIEYILIYAKDINNFEPFHPVYKKTELMSYIQRMKEDNKSFKYTTVLYRCENREYFKTIKDGAGDDIVIERVLDYETKSVKQVAQLEGITEEEVYEKYYDQIYTHCKARLDKVVDGTDQGGISKELDWQGGGGYHFYELAPSLLVKNDKLPIYQINPSYTFEMLCEAICKIEGFRYKPQDVFHGHSSEKRYIHITTEFINAGYIKSLSARLAEGQSLLIYGTKIQSDMVLPDNIEVKKFPKDLLEKCDFESEVQ